MKIKIIFLLVAHQLVFSNSYSAGMADYTSNEDALPAAVPRGTIPPKANLIKNIITNESLKGKDQSFFNSSERKYLSLETEYSTLNVRSGKSGEVNIMGLKAGYYSDLDIFGEIDYWGGKSSSAELISTSSFQSGNPKLLLGLNLINLPYLSERSGLRELILSIYGGAQLKVTQSDFGSSRNDKILGLRINKHYSRFALLFSAEMRKVGKSHEENDFNIGDLTWYEAAFIFHLSDRFRLFLEGGYGKIKASPFQDSSNYLSHDISFSGITPKISYLYNEFTEIMMKADLRHKKPQSTSALLDAKLYDYPYIYGSSVALGLNFYL